MHNLPGDERIAGAQRQQRNANVENDHRRTVLFDRFLQHLGSTYGDWRKRRRGRRRRFINGWRGLHAAVDGTLPPAIIMQVTRKACTDHTAVVCG